MRKLKNISLYGGKGAHLIWLSERFSPAKFAFESTPLLCPEKQIKKDGNSTKESVCPSAVEGSLQGRNTSGNSPRLRSEKLIKKDGNPTQENVCPSAVEGSLQGLSTFGNTPRLCPEKQPSKEKYPYNIPPFFIIKTTDHKDGILSQEAKEKIIEFLRNHPHSDFAVRSSATVEDSERQSFAGQFKTYLHIKPKDVEEAIGKVVASAASDHIKQYAHTTDIKMAIVVQQMIPSRVSGVVFGANPVNGSTEETIVSALYGLGEGLVSGKLNADTYSWRENSWHINVADKETAFQLKGNSITEVPIAKEKQAIPCLNEVQLEQLRQLSDNLKEEFGQPQDIEFCYRKDELYILQTRPITNLTGSKNFDGTDPGGIKTANGLRAGSDRSVFDGIVTAGNAADKNKEEHDPGISTPDQRPVVEPVPKPFEGSREAITHLKIWDNSNIVESYPGVTTPLTFSFILRMYRAVYEQLSVILGVSPKKVERNTEVYANMLGLIKGRVYYNLINWYRALAMAPGFSLNARFMEKMMGTDEAFDLPESEREGKWKTRLHFVSSIFKLISAYRGLPVQTRKFQAYINEVMADYKALDLESLSASELLQKIEEYENIMLLRWKAPLVNDFFTMIYFGVYQKAIGKWYNGSNDQLHNDLLIGSSDIISARPIAFFKEVDMLIRSKRGLKKLFTEATPKFILEELQKPENNEISRLIFSYLDAFGDRSVGELKLETVTYRQEPERLISRIQKNLSQTQSGERENLSKVVRNGAETELFDKVKNPIKRKLLRYLIRHTRRLVSNRENLRYERTRAFGMIRQMFLAMGDKLTHENYLENKRDIFYLKEQEIFDLFKGTAATTSLKGLVKLRKSEFMQYENEKAPPERIKTYGMVYQNLDQTKTTAKPKGELKGLACCAGIVRAKVRLIHHPDEAESLDGEILVTSSTDPGWISLFYGAAGILTERGSLLSHSAIVSREMGIPCIVAIKGLLTGLKDGDEVEMNGSTGEIKILNHA